jgi:hypothetical protein
MHVSRWDLEKPEYEPGSWLRGTIYPQRCDLSPDGRWLVFFTLKASAERDLGPTYIAISRLPWLTALAAWGIGSTWTRGMQFLEDASVWEVDEPDVGDLDAVRGRFGLRMSRADSFAVERRRGWTETGDTPPRASDDAWDERRGDRIVMQKIRPSSNGSERLTVRGTYAAIRELHGVRTDVRYELHRAGGPTHLDGSSGPTGMLVEGCWSRRTTAGCRSATPGHRYRASSRGRPTRARSLRIRPLLLLKPRSGERPRRETRTSRRRSRSGSEQ